MTAMTHNLATMAFTVLLASGPGPRWLGGREPLHPKIPGPFEATGYFHTAFAAGRWWLVTPSGRPFYSSGIDHVSSNPDTDRKTGVCPYCVTIASRYPSLEAWASATVDRLRSWGFNTLGPWSDTGLLATKMPYTVLLDMASGNDWFSPAFATHADQVAARDVAPLANDPNLVGWYLDSELHWGPDWRGQRSLLDDYLALPVGSPGRTVAQQYVGDPDGFLYALATRYFEVTTAAVHAYDSHHLILGVKAVAQLIQPELLEAARTYVDVFSVDDYALVPGLSQAISQVWPMYLPQDATLSTIEEYIRRPILVSEYSFRAADSGLANSWPPIYPTYATQQERADAYADFVETLYRSAPWVVGDDWFEYTDEPAGGRFDGEDSNFGVVSTSDVPYTTLVERMAAGHAEAPGSRFEHGWRCGSWARVDGRLACNAWLPPSGRRGRLGRPGAPSR